MQSPLSGLSDVLKLVKSSAENYGGQLQRNEAVTRAVLIDPVLRALGWDVANPAMVEVEKPIAVGGKSGFLDYHLNAEQPIIIEAKKLGEPLENYFAQLATYAIMMKIDNVFITDGLKWSHYTNISPSNQSPVKQIDLGKLEESELTKAAAYFVETLDAALYAPEIEKVEDVLQQKLNELERKLSDMERMFVSFANASGTAILPSTSTGYEPETSQSQWLDLDGSWDAKKKKPAQLRLPDGGVVDVRSWTQILVEASKFCFKAKTGLLQQLPIEDRTGRATKLISRIQPPSNLNSDSFIIDGETVYVCTNYSANDCIANVKYLFEKVTGGANRAAILLAN